MEETPQCVDLAETARLIHDGRLEAANGLLRIALLQPHTPEQSVEVCLQLAQLHLKRGDPHRARRFVGRILVDVPNHAEALSTRQRIDAALATGERRAIRWKLALLVVSTCAVGVWFVVTR